MPGSVAVFLKIAALFLVVLAGYLARRRYLGPAVVNALSRFVADWALPALILGQMVDAGPALLTQGWRVLTVAAVTIALALSTGWAASRATHAPSRPTLAFLVGIPNWVYLPLPIAEALYGQDGVSIVLVYNVGGLAVMWTLGVFVLRGGKLGLDSLGALLFNPGLLATVAGGAIALLAPQLGPDELRGSASAAAQGGVVVWSAVDAIGSLTVPLSLLLTGAQLGAGPASGAGRRGLWAAVGGRLILAPAVAIAAGVIAARLGFALPEMVWMLSAVIASMPIAVSCAPLTERFGGDIALASRAIFVSTLLSMLTTPAWMAVAEKLLG